MTVAAVVEGEGPVAERALQQRHRVDRIEDGRRGQRHQPGAEGVPDEVDPDAGGQHAQQGHQALDRDQPDRFFIV